MKAIALTTIEPGLISSVLLDENQTFYFAYSDGEKIITTNLKRASRFCGFNYKAVFASVKKYGYFKSKTNSSQIVKIEVSLSTVFDYEID